MTDTRPAELPLSDDRPHAPGDDEWWQESVVMGWADPEAEIGGFIRIGHQPNRGYAKCCFGVTSLNGQGYARTAQDLAIGPNDRTEDSFAADGFVRATFDRQRSRWIAQDEHCALDLAVSDVHPTYNFWDLTNSHTEVSATMAPNHIQGGGTFTGMLRLVEAERPISGFTYRDHSWGRRHLHNPNADLYAGWWLGGSFGPDFSFGFGDARVMSGLTMPFSYIVKDGEVLRTVIEDASVSVALSDGMSARSARVTVMAEKLGRLTFEAEGFGNVVLELEQKHFELSMPCRIRCGDRVGGGTVETILNPRNGTHRPIFLAGASLHNGLYTLIDGLVQQPAST